MLLGLLVLLMSTPFAKMFSCIPFVNQRIIQRQYQQQQFSSVTTTTTDYDPDVLIATLTDTVPFIPPLQYGLVVKVYDGDTITIATKLPLKDPYNKVYRFSVRLNGIDCPEIKGKCQSEKAVAQVAKQTLSDMILGKVVTFQNVSFEKYGRILADVYFNDIHLNEYMVENRLAVRYDGGTKQCPDDWLVYYKGISP